MNPSVNVAELRRHLSGYLGRVRRGEEILIRDRSVAVAKLVPLAAGGHFEEHLRTLAADGLVRLPHRRLNVREFLGLPKPKVARKRLLAAIEAEREEG